MSIENPYIDPNEFFLNRMADIMTEAEVSNSGKLIGVKALNRISEEIIEGCQFFTPNEKSNYKEIIEKIKSLLNGIVFSDKSIEEKKQMCLEKAELIGKLPSRYEIRRNIILITTIPDLENTDLLK